MKQQEGRKEGRKQEGTEKYDTLEWLKVDKESTDSRLGNLISYERNEVQSVTFVE